MRLRKPEARAPRQGPPARRAGVVTLPAPPVVVSHPTMLPVLRITATLLLGGATLAACGDRKGNGTPPAPSTAPSAGASGTRGHGPRRRRRAGEPALGRPRVARPAPPLRARRGASSSPTPPTPAWRARPPGASWRRSRCPRASPRGRAGSCGRRGGSPRAGVAGLREAARRRQGGREPPLPPRQGGPEEVRRRLEAGRRAVDQAPHPGGVHLLGEAQDQGDRARLARSPRRPALRPASATPPARSRCTWRPWRRCPRARSSPPATASPTRPRAPERRLRDTW